MPHFTGALRRNGIGRLQSSLKHRSFIRPKFLTFDRRYASAQVSPTAINVQPHIPARNEELYSALSKLNKEAEQYVNVSRVQLALRNLAAQDPVIRVAVLSLGSQLDAQRAVRLLLADPLGPKESWEDELEQADERAVLLRYGDGQDRHPPTPLYKVLSIPSRVLRAHNLEILLSTLNADVSNSSLASTAESSQEAIFVPKLMATSARGLPVPYPVHKTLVIGEGLDKAVAFGRFTADISSETGDMLRVAIDMKPATEDSDPTTHSTCSVVNIDSGAKALSAFRESIANSVLYERGWSRSGMPSISQWLTQDLQPAEPIKPAMKDFIFSITEDAEANITKEDIVQLQTLTQSAAQQQTSGSMLGHLEAWAEKSHTELRDQLDAAFFARHWHKLAWWKLFWRVDDVSMIASEIIERRWLTDAEKGGVFLAGRMEQAGFPDVVPYKAEPVVAPSTQNTAAQEPEKVCNLSPPQPMALSTDVREVEPWHTQISTSRASLLQTTVPPLQALAQNLVLRTLSTTSLASALSALLWVSMPTISVFEAGAIAALGLVYSLRRMQKVWEKAREDWQVEVREDGRKTLKFTEDLVRWIVKGSEKNVEDSESVMRRRRAREAIEKVREVLKKL